MDLENIAQTSEFLIQFEKELVDSCIRGEINGPVHFAEGNEVQLIKLFRGLRPGDYVLQSDDLKREDVLRNSSVVVPSALGNEPYFKGISPNDFIFTSYRNHPHILLKGMPPEEARQNILIGRSMYPMSDKHGIFSSAIVPGHLNAATGLALARKMSGSSNKVWAFCGDMASQTGTFHECSNYAANHKLPITFVIEDNGMSVDTPTRTAWGIDSNTIPRLLNNTIYYAYNNAYKHQGRYRTGVGGEVGF